MIRTYEAWFAASVLNHYIKLKACSPAGHAGQHFPLGSVSSPLSSSLQPSSSRAWLPTQAHYLRMRGGGAQDRVIFRAPWGCQCSQSCRCRSLQVFCSQPHPAAQGSAVPGSPARVVASTQLRVKLLIRGSPQGLTLTTIILCGHLSARCVPHIMATWANAASLHFPWHGCPLTPSCSLGEYFRKTALAGGRWPGGAVRPVTR